VKNNWFFKDKEFNSVDIPKNAVGFVYEITDLLTGKKYIGKKNFFIKQKRPPLKGKKRKRITIKESDWQDYFGSSDNVKKLLEENGAENFSRKILMICYSKGELSYAELYVQVIRGVLMSDNYLNGIIQCRINQSHIKNINIKDLEALKD
jgi:hypothetical protein